MPQRITHCLIFICLFHIGVGQVKDDFADGDFTEGLTWDGNATDFEINEIYQLQLNAPSETSQSYIATQSSFLNNTTWEFYVELGFNPSSSNQLFVYLVSDMENLSESVNGYFVRIGNSDDEVSLYRQEGTSKIKIIDGADDVLNTNQVTLRVRVTRDDNGKWELFRDALGGRDFISEGSVSDDTFSNSAFFGFLCDYTATRSDLFFLDDVVISKPLGIDTVIVNSSTEIEVKFDQWVKAPEASASDHFQLSDVDLISFNILTATRDNADLSSILLTVSPLPTAALTLTINDLKDSIAEEPVSNLAYQFSYTNLQINSLLTLSETEIQLRFSDDLDLIAAEDESNYSISPAIGQPLSAEVHAADQSQVTLLLENPLYEEATFQLGIYNLLNSSKNSTLNVTEGFSFVTPLIIDTLYALSETSVLLAFNKNLKRSLGEDPSNYTIDNGIGTPMAATVRQDGKSVLLEFSSSFENVNYSVSVSNLEDLSGNEVTSGSTTFDYLNLSILALEQVDERSVLVRFNQPLEDVSATNIYHYFFDEIGHPESASFTDTSSDVLLQFDQLYNSAYTLFVGGVLNAYQNSTASDLEVTIDVEVSSAYRSVIINELLPDPTPTVGLPEAEYIELFNISGHSINLENFLLNDEPLPDYTLEAGSLVVIADDENAALFNQPNSMLLSSFDVLTNGGEEVVLKDQFGNTIDSISYDLSWYGDHEKDDGGYSLELINPLQPCSGKQNWSASVHTNGGTPGEQNSVYTDIADGTAPHLAMVEVIGKDTLYLAFSEPLGQSSISTASFGLSDYTFSALTAINYAEYYLKADQDLVSEVSYLLSVTGVSDCFGNTLSSQDVAFYYDIKGPEPERLIVLSENEIGLLFHESLNETDAEDEDNFFIGGAHPNRAILQESSSRRVHLTFEIPFFEGEVYTIEHSGLTDILGNESISGETSFTFEDKIDTVYTVAPNLLEVVFAERPLENAATGPGHYWVTEGAGRPQEVIPDEEDPNLYRLAFESNFEENEELKLYMEGIKAANGQRLVTPAYSFIYDTRAPTIEELVVENDSQLVIGFDEQVDLQLATASSLYTLEDDENPFEVVALSDKLLKLTFDRKFPVEMQKTLSVKGINDRVGNTMKSTRSIRFVYDPRPPQVVAVQHLNDTSLLVKFSEITQRSTLLKTKFSLEIGNPYFVKPVGPDSLSVILYFTSIPISSSAELTVGDIQDNKGNLSADSVYLFNSLNPRIASLQPLSDTLLQVDFTKPMSKAAVAIDHYVLRGFDLKNVEPISDFSYQLTLAEPLSDGDSLILKVQGLTDQDGNPLLEAKWESVFNSYVEAIRVLDGKTVELVFNTVFSTISKTSFSMDEHNVALATLDGEDTSRVFLSLQKPMGENEPYLLGWNRLSDAFDRKLPALAKRITYDTKPPEVLEVSSEFFGSVILTFSEAVNTDLARSLNKYQIVGLGDPGAVEVLHDSVLLLDFQDQLAILENYQLIVQEAVDLNGNFTERDTLTVTYKPPEVPSYKQIVINEIMADPTPSAGLPEEEYFELYNVSDKTFNLKGLQLWDNNKAIALPDHLLAPMEYVLITSDATMYTSPAVSVGSLPALVNGGDSITLINIYGELVDKISYDISWYADDEKSDGGYSLELINPFGGCPESYKWRASESGTGGTPGEKNSVYNTGPDNQRPMIEKVEIIDPKTIALQFNEPMDSLSLVSVLLEIEAFGVENRVSGGYFEVLTLQLSEALEIGISYPLIVSGARDCSGTEMMVDTLELVIGKVPDAGDLLITEIMADPDPAAGLPDSEYLEFYNHSNLVVSLADLFLIDATDTTYLPEVNVQPESYFVLCPEARRAAFPDSIFVIGLSRWLSLNNTGERIILAGIETIDEVAYSRDWYRDTDKAEGGYSLEIVNPFSNCPGNVNWEGSVSETGGTPGRQNSVFSVGPDATLPEILVTEVVDTQTVRIIFTEVMDSLSLASIQIEAEDVSVAGKTIAGTYSDVLLLHFTNAIREGRIYTIKISGARDCTGNEMETTNVSFGLGKKPGFNELLITEIMADPDPSVGLPVSEYLEIYNTSNQLLSLDGLFLSDGGDTTALPTVILEADQYLLLLPTSSVPLFESTNKIGVRDWISLANGGEDLFILNGEKMLFQVGYSIDWHHSQEKSEGGYSLEMKDVSNPCAGSLNWGSSISAVGGTPGLPNSNVEEVPDNFGPNLLAVNAVTADSLVLNFDEALMPELAGMASFSVIPEVFIQKVYQNDHRRSQICLKLAEELQVNQIYSLKIQGVTDCSGNPARNSSRSFVLPDDPDSLDLILNEILFDPRTGGVDFVEIYNKSEKYLDLKGWQIARLNEDKLESRIIADEAYVIGPNSHLAITTDTLLVKSQYPGASHRDFFQIPALPTFPNDAGTVVLTSPAGGVSDRFAYSDDYHQPFLESVDGVSLERISADAPTQDPNNWQSASAMAGFATPGYVNSQSFEAPAISGAVKITPKVFIPNSSNAAHQSFTTINYQLDKGGQFANIIIYNQLGQPVAELAKGSSLSTSGFIRWDGTDASGNIVRMGYYVVLFELYDSNGNQQVLKETVVVGR